MAKQDERKHVTMPQRGGGTLVGVRVFRTGGEMHPPPRSSLMGPFPLVSPVPYHAPYIDPRGSEFR